MQPLSEYISDVLIIGSGAAGLSLALRLAQHHKVTVLSKDQFSEGATFYAQGGIAVVFDQTDSINSHINDTLMAGAGLCDKKVVEFITENARHCVQWLINQGVSFDTQINLQGKKNYHLTREGGHSHRRILHIADTTGKAIESTLIGKASINSNIIKMERCHAVDLITSNTIGTKSARRVVGVYVWNATRQKMETYSAKVVVLATGGAAKVYQYTTNPDISSGDGIAMAWRAGCRVANLEFNQFHPTCLFHSQARNFLLTEALRGEGAYLKRPDGTRFMPDFDIRGELAPRDIVVRAIDYEMKRLGVDCMYLDITHKSEEFINRHFPMIHEKLQTLGFNLTQEPIPIVPSAHYTCGGVIVDMHGRTDLAGLYAIGEVSYTGLHGANRMASNSLLECLVYAWSASEDILKRLPLIDLSKPLPQLDTRKVDNTADTQIVIKHHLNELRLVMWDYVGIIRTTKRMEKALRRINELQIKIDKYYYDHFPISHDLLELRNLVKVSELIVRSAISRKESRGLHYTLDYPLQLLEAIPTILHP